MKKALFLFFCSVCITKFGYTQTVSDTIDFSAYESETIITDQYLSESFLFSGYDGSGDPRVYDYGVGSYGRVLRSDDWYNPIKVSFVDSADTDVFRLIEKLDFDNPIDSEVDYISVDAYDSMDVLVVHHVSTSPEHVSLDFASENIAYVVFDDSAFTAYVIDNLIVEFAKGN
ncbi:MAG: hypothetical protein H7X71_07335, partial [Chitinophagales bacterium]|nr:hypothetical protein [Chitinophagales bacterium]